MGTIRGLGCALLAAVATAALAASAPARVLPPSVYTYVDLDRLAYHDGVHRASFRTHGLCVAAQDTVAVRGRCTGESVRGTAGSAYLGFEVQRYAEAVPADAPVAQTQTFEGEQLVRVAVDLHDGGDLRVEVAAVSTDEVSAAPVDGSQSDGGRVDERSVTWDLGTVQPGSYEVSARFSVSADPRAVAGFVPQVTVQRSDESPRAIEYFGGGVDAPRPVRRFHTLTLRQHVAAPAAAPKLDAGTLHPDADVAVPQAWAGMPSYVGRGFFYEPDAGRRKVETFELEDLSPGAGDRVNTASMGWAYWSPQPGPKVEPIAGFAYVRGPKLVGFEMGIKTAGHMRYGVSPQTPGPIYDGDAGSIGITASAGVVRSRADRPPSRRGGTLQTTWDGSIAQAWSDLGQTPVPFAEPNAGSPGSSTFTEPMLLTEAGVQVYARGGDVDNRTGDERVEGKPIVLRGQWAFAAISTTAPRGSRYRPIVELAESELRITPAIRPGGYMLENERSGWDADWSAFHSLGWMEYAAHRGDDAGMVKTYSFPRGATAQVDVLLPDGVHEILRGGPGKWRLTVTRSGVDWVKLSAA